MICSKTSHIAVPVTQAWTNSAFLQIQMKVLDFHIGYYIHYCILVVLVRDIFDALKK